MDALSPVATTLFLKKVPKVLVFLCYQLQVVLRSLIYKCLLFCMLRRILRILVKKYCFLLFSKKYWCQHFCWNSRLIILQNAWLSPFFFLDSNSFCKDLLFPHGANLAQKPPYLVGTVLKAWFSKIWTVEVSSIAIWHVVFTFFRFAITTTEPLHDRSERQWENNKRKTNIGRASAW